MGCVPSNSQPVLTLCMLGLPGVGKTSIIEALAGEYNEKDPPIATNGIIKRELEIKGHIYRFLDLCGFLSHAEEWEMAIEQSDAAVLVFDPLAIETAYVHIKNQFDIYGPLIQERKIPCLVVINKTNGENLQLRKKLFDLIGEIQRSKAIELNKLTKEEIGKEIEWIRSYLRD